MKVFRMLTAGAILMALAAPAYATPVTIDFRGLTDNTSANGEINGTEFLAQGLSLSTLLGSTFNVGCGTGNSCLGADLAAVDDFTGVIRGSFVDNSLNAATVTSLAINFCCSGTVSMLYDVNNVLLGTFVGSFSYTGAAVTYWETDFGYDGMFDLTYDGLQTSAASAVPEPASLALLAAGLAGVAVRLRRRRSF